MKLAIIGVGVGFGRGRFESFSDEIYAIELKKKIVRDLSDLLNELREFSSTRADDWVRWVGEMYHFAVEIEHSAVQWCYSKANLFA